jgi:hypothetical protein
MGVRVPRSAFGVQRSEGAFGVGFDFIQGAFAVHCSPFAVHCSLFTGVLKVVVDPPRSFSLRNRPRPRAQTFPAQERGGRFYLEGSSPFTVRGSRFVWGVAHSAAGYLMATFVFFRALIIIYFGRPGDKLGPWRTLWE